MRSPARTLTVLLLALALSGTSAAADQPASTTVRRFALIIGANDGGKERVVLRYAHSDAESMAKVLRELGGVWPQDHVLLLEPDRYGMLSGLKMMETKLQIARAHEGLRIELIFYFSGHSDENGLLLSGQRFDYDELKAALKELPADVRIAILDSCASGALTRGKGGKRRPPFLVDASSQVRGHAYLASASVDEQAQESERVGGSFFTHYLVSGLRGAADTSQDRRVTLNEAYHHAFHETLARTQSTLGGPQHPNYDIQLAGSGDLVLTDLRGTSALLVFDKNLQGRAWVRDARRRLVAEIDKRFGQNTRLGLEPGLYEVTWEKPAAMRRGTVTLVAGKEHAFDPAKLSQIESEKTVSRGGTRQPPVAVPGAVAPAPAEPPKPKPKDIREARRLYKAQQREAKLRLRAFERAEKKRIRAERTADKEFVKQAKIDRMPAAEIKAELRRRRAAREADVAQRRAAVEAAPGPPPRPPDPPAQPGTPAPPTASGADDKELQATPEDRLQTRTPGESIPVAACIVPGVSSFMFSDGPHDHVLSFNFLCLADDLHGFELSLAGAMRKGDVSGAQLAGLFNYVGGEFHGFQLAGLGNVTDGPSSGFQAAMIGNVARGAFRGFQGAPLFNFAGSAAYQLAGALNMSAGSGNGLQLAGLINHAQGIRGAQVAWLGNIAGQITGLQFAAGFNYADHVEGLQLGLFNFSASNDGVSLGLLSVAGDGLFEPTAWASDTGFVNVGLKLGTRKLYSLFAVGYHDLDDERWTSLITGLGAHIELDPFYIDIDVVTHWLQDDHAWGHGNLDLMTKLRITAGLRLGKQFSFYVGPSLNYMISEVRDSAGLWDYEFWRKSGDEFNHRLWPGLVFGIQVEPQLGRLNPHRR